MNTGKIKLGAAPLVQYYLLEGTVRYMGLFLASRAPPSGFPSSSGYISPYIPPLVIIQIQCTGQCTVRPGPGSPSVTDFIWQGVLISIQGVCKAVRR